MEITLSDILGFIEDNKEDYESAANGNSGPSSDWETADLPLTQEYRVEIFKAEYKASKAGNNQMVLSMVILEPEEFAGKRFQDYVNPNPTNEFASKSLAQLYGSLRADASGLDKRDVAGYVQRFVGKRMVVALRAWGEANDRRGLRWTNYDSGQNLRDSIKPQAPKKTAAALRPDLNIPRREVDANGPFPDTPTPVTPPNTGSVSTPNLPPGLLR